MVSFAVQKLLSLIRSLLFIFVFIFIALGAGLISKTYKQLMQFNNKNQPNQRVGRRSGRYFSKEDIWMAKKHVKRYSMSLITREMQIKSLRYHLTPVRMAIIKKSRNNKCWRGCGEKRTLLYVGGNVNWYSHYGEQCGGSLQKLKIDPAIPLLDIYPEKTIIQKDTSTPMFIVALFAIAKTWKQSKCPSTEECIKMLYIYTVGYYSAI